MPRQRKEDVCIRCSTIYTPSNSRQMYCSRECAAAAIVAARQQKRLKLDRSWVVDAACIGTDPDLFFPERGQIPEQVKTICQGCQVRVDCLEYALAANENVGVWGGLSTRSRQRLKAQRRRNRAA